MIFPFPEWVISGLKLGIVALFAIIAVSIFAVFVEAYWETRKK